jgi:hypothetical protein
MERNAVLFMLVAAAATGCSTVDKIKDGPDTSPSRATAVMETHLVSEGLKGFFPFEGTNKTYTRGEMQRAETSMKGTGTVTRFLIGSHSDLRIERLDKKLIYTLDTKEKTYTECPLKGCGTGTAEKAPPKEPEEKKAEKPADSGCKMKMTKSTFNVQSTGQKKNINNFDTEEYKAAWVITLQDPTARKTVSTLAVNVWTTPLTGPLKDALGIEQTYARNLANNLVSIATNGRQTQVVPDEAARVINAYLAQMMAPADRAAFLKAGKELEKIKGYPVLTQIAWNLAGDACAGSEPAADSDKSSASSGKGDLLSSVTDYFAKKKTDDVAKDIAGKPIFSFTSEVKSHKVESVHDSLFLPPTNFKLANPK